MTTAQWFMLIGGLLLVMGLTSSLLRRAPVTSAIIYLAVGVAVGPSALNLFHFNPLKEAALLEVLTEMAVLISLFSAGVKMPVPFTLARWRAPIMLATLSMAITVGLVAAFAHFVLGLPLGAGVLLGAILAPTDPVLATDVQVRHPGDRDQLRFNLTCEAGMNDGSAFPFVVLGLGLLGLHDMGDFGLRWVLVDVLWATAAGIGIGVIGGVALARLSGMLRRAPYQHELMDDFLGLGLIGVVYGVATLAHAWGFLAVFFAAVALRQTELKQSRAEPLPENDAAATAANAAVGDSRTEPFTGPLTEPQTSPLTEPLTQPLTQPLTEPPPGTMVSTGSLVFKEHLERLSELALVLLVGGALFLDSWSWQAVAMALFLFVVARPVSVLLVLWRANMPLRTQGMIGWFGVRGIGSLYYMMYAVQHGLPEPLALQLIQMTLIVVTLSILMHGVSVKPLMAAVLRRKQIQRQA